MGTSATRKATIIGIGFLGLLISMKIAIGNSASPPVSKTGAPNENKCIQCHQGTAGTGSVSMVFGNNETQYVPGQQYTIQVSTLDPTRTRFGFQVTALAGGVGATVGTFSLINTANTVTQTATVSGSLRRYVAHKSANSNQNWSFNWTAPPTDVGPITFFLVGVAANNNNGSTGDKVYSTTFDITAVPPPPPVANFSASSTSMCAESAVTFTDLSTHSPTGYQWLFPGGTPSNSTASNPTVVYFTPGTYDVTLIASNASGADTLSIPQYIIVSALPQLAGLPSSTSCFEGGDGSINVTASGTAPFSYAWSHGSSAEDPSGLSAGTYVVTVTDANGCTAFASYTVNEPAQISLNFSSQSANCGQFNGSATVTATGGVGGYTYLWGNGNTTATASNLAAGAHDVTVTDANGCQATGAVAVSNVGAPTGTTAVTNPTCNGDSDGAIDLSITGGVSPFSFQWSTGATTEDIAGLSSGTYSVTVTSFDGCVLSQVVTVQAPPILAASVSSTPEMAGADGTATVTPVGGNGGYTYLWSDGQTTSTATHLSAGTYTVTVTDSMGCTITETVNVSLVISVGGSIRSDPFTIGPNPFHDHLTLQPTVSIHGKFVVHLVDIKGRIVYASELYAQGSLPVRVEPGPLPGGIYLLLVHTAKGDMTRKLIHTSL